MDHDTPSGQFDAKFVQCQIAILGQAVGDPIAMLSQLAARWMALLWRRQ
jgi:hypothetical protein